MVKQLLVAQNRVFDGTGAPAASATVAFYRTGTTTLVTIYADAAKSATLANPLPADASGFIPEVFYDSAFEVRRLIKASDGTTIEDMDPIPQVSTTDIAASAVTFSPVTGNPETDVQAAIAALQSEVLSVGVRWCTFAASATNVFTLTSAAGEPLTSIPAGLRVGFLPSSFSQSGAFTLNLDGLGAVTAKTVSNATPPADYLLGRPTFAFYDGTNWLVGREPQITNSGARREFADGTLICTGSVNATAAGPNTWEFPGVGSGAAGFSEAPAVAANGINAAARHVTFDSIAADGVSFYVYDAAGTKQTLSGVLLSAVGRWY